LLKGSPVFSAIVALILLGSTAFLLNLLMVQNDLHPRNSFLVVIFYLVLMSWNRSMLCLNPVLPASFILIISIFTIQRMYGLFDAFTLVLTASFLVALASLFYYPAACFILFIWLGLLTYRIASWREWVLSVIGFTLPYLYLATFYYLINRLPENVLLFTQTFHVQNWELHKVSPVHLAFYIASGIILLFSAYTHFAAVQDKVISFRKRTGMVNNFMLAGIPVIIIASANLEISHAFLFIPLAFYMGNLVAFSKGKRSGFDYLFLLYILFIFVIRFTT
jgi:hypothetical protein